jgi:hypothetical protein
MEQNPSTGTSVNAGRYFKYAIGEIILVVIGILIALQINNWNEDKKNALKERQYLESFKIDLQRNIEELERVVKKSEMTSVLCDSLLRLPRTKNLSLEDDNLNRHFFAGIGFTIYKSQEGSINDIMGSGSLALITNDSIRLAIGSWEANLKDLREWEKLEKNSWQKYITYLEKHFALYKTAFQEPELDTEKRLQVLEDNYFLNLVADRVMTSGELNQYYLTELAKTQKLLVQVEKELGGN